MAPTPAIWTQGGSFTAAQDRALVSALMGGRHFVDLAPGVSKTDAGGAHGVVGGSDLLVSAGAGHSVNVAAGQAFVRGTQTAGQGTYLLGNDATYNVAVSTPDATNPRIDLVQIKVTDDSAGAGANTINVKSGSPAGSPTAPTPDENSLVLATVLVPASAASSANYTITDVRTFATALGGVHRCTSSTRPSSPYEGMEIYETDTDNCLVWDGAVWTLPKNRAGGTLDYGQRTTSMGPATFATVADLDSSLLRVDFSLPSTRRVRVTGYVRSVEATAANARIVLQIRRVSDSVVMEELVLTAHDAANVGGSGGQVVWSPLLSAGTHAYVLSALAADAASFTFAASTTAPAWLLAEDIGGI